jgi:hypothetical protein
MVWGSRAQCEVRRGSGCIEAPSCRRPLPRWFALWPTAPSPSPEALPYLYFRRLTATMPVSLIWPIPTPDLRSSRCRGDEDLEMRLVSTSLEHPRPKGLSPCSSWLPGLSLQANADSSIAQGFPALWTKKIWEYGELDVYKDSSLPPGSNVGSIVFTAKIVPYYHP